MTSKELQITLPPYSGGDYSIDQIVVPNNDRSIVQIPDTPLKAPSTFRKAKSLKQNWQTPRYLFKEILNYFPNVSFFSWWDVAASKENALCDNYYYESYLPDGSPDPKNNGLVAPWGTHNYCNPPYKRVYPWVVKALQERDKRSCTTVFLLNACTDTAWFHMLKDNGASIGFIRGRINFVDPENPEKNNPSLPSIIAVVSPDINYNIGTWIADRVSRMKPKKIRGRKKVKKE